jgi:hypothetical protein
MRTPSLQPYDLLLPAAFPRDAHLAAAEAMLRRLAAGFPSAGLGISGSVSKGTHRPDSDVDLLMVDASFRREMQFAAVSGGIRTAVLCLNPAFDAERERRWMLAAGGDVPTIVMVRMAFVARDPADALGGMQRTLARLDAERQPRRDELFAARREDALATAHALRREGGVRSVPLQLALFDAIVDGWYLKHGLVMASRKPSERFLDVIAAHDPLLSALLRAAVPVTHASQAPLLRACALAFGTDGSA